MPRNITDERLMPGNSISAPISTYDGVSNVGNTYHGENLHFNYGNERNQCLRDLLITDPRDERREILARKDSLLKDSCLWVYDDPAFVQWRNNDNSQTLWIHGDPGKGKTMIMMALTNEALNRSKMSNSSNAISFFFCQNTNSNTNTATSILRGLIYMLVKGHPPLLRYVQKKYDDSGAQSFEGSSALY